MHFGRLNVQFVNKVRRFCAKLPHTARKPAQGYIKSSLSCLCSRTT